MFWQKHGIEKKDLLTPVSILVGSVFISISVFWSSGNLPFSGTGSALADAQGEIPSGVAQPVKLSERKNAPSIGSGKVTLVEFSDFQCPFCQRFFNDTYGQIKSKYIDTGKLKLSFRHYPLPFHANAQKAAEAAECANNQGKFSSYHDLLFKKTQSDGTGISVSDLKQYAQDLGLDTAKFNSCLDNGEMADAVKKDLEDGKKAGVDGTPTFFINGEKIMGAQPFSVFEAAIEKALK